MARSRKAAQVGPSSFPANGRFSPAQGAVYDIVLEAQQAAIDTVAPGVRFEEVHAAALRVLVRGLRRLGVLEGGTDRLIRRQAHAPYFMHGTSHWLGLDVHDVGGYRDGEESIVLRPGMVLTVEPGLYFGPGARAPRRLRGIGVRIEDDVLVTRGGRRNLSAAIPSDPETLEALAGSSAWTRRGPDLVPCARAQGSVASDSDRAAEGLRRRRVRRLHLAQATMRSLTGRGALSARTCPASRRFRRQRPSLLRERGQ